MSPSGRLLAVGDIHGCVEELERLLEAVAPQPADQLVFLGDYIDRGPASSAVVDLLVRERARLPRTVFLRGNHEDMLLGFLSLDGGHGDAFLWNGGDKTIASYGVEMTPGGVPPETVAAALPAAHVSFLCDTRLSFVAGRYTFVHAGIRPGIPLERQDREDLLWIREEFLRQDHGLPTTVVFGHTPRREVTLDLPCKIGLDTGAVYGGKLSCLDLSDFVLYQVERRARKVKSRALAIPH
jgi:serine/threonine protein phosphatase 1